MTLLHGVQRSDPGVRVREVDVRLDAGFTDRAARGVEQARMVPLGRASDRDLRRRDPRADAQPRQQRVAGDAAARDSEDARTPRVGCVSSPITVRGTPASRCRCCAASPPKGRRGSRPQTITSSGLSCAHASRTALRMPGPLDVPPAEPIEPGTTSSTSSRRARAASRRESS